MPSPIIKKVVGGTEPSSSPVRNAKTNLVMKPRGGKAEPGRNVVSKQTGSGIPAVRNAVNQPGRG